MQNYERKKISNAMSRVYWCPLFKSCDCRVQWRMIVNEMEAVFQLECNGRHTSDSHAKFKGKFLAPRQKEAVIRAVQNDPNCTGNTVIRNMRNFADERVQIDHGLKDSVERLVRSERDAVLSRNLGGVNVAGNRNDEVKKLRKLCADRRFDLALKRHNSREAHIQPHQMLITSMQWAPDIHYGMTTVNDIMNVGRAINAGEVTFYTDATFGICKNEVCLVGVWVGKRCDGTVIVGYSINPSESEDAMRATYEGFQACFFGIFKRLRLCTNSNCVLCRNIAEILKGEEMIRYQSSSKWEDMEFPETKQMADEGGGHHAYMTNDRPDSLLLKCYQHLGSEWIYFEIVNIMCIFGG